MKKGIIISLFVLIISYGALGAEDFRGTFWASVSGNGEMKSLLLIEFGTGSDCRLTHAYLRTGEKEPFDRDTTVEEWYQTRNDLIIIQDTWGEFVPLRIIGPSRLETNLGKDIISLHRITPGEREKILEEFYLSGQ